MINLSLVLDPIPIVSKYDVIYGCPLSMYAHLDLFNMLFESHMVCVHAAKVVSIAGSRAKGLASCAEIAHLGQNA